MRILGIVAEKVHGCPLDARLLQHEPALDMDQRFASPEEAGDAK